jgi:hypothetical protein
MQISKKTKLRSGSDTKTTTQKDKLDILLTAGFKQEMAEAILKILDI